MYVPFPRRDHTGNAQTEQVYIKLLSISWSVVTDPADVETEQQPSISSLDPKAIPTLCTQTPPSGCHRGYKKKKTKKQKTDLLRRLCLLFKTRISKCSGKGWNRFPGHIWSCLLVVVLLPHPSRHVNLPLLTVHTQADGAPDVKHGL